MAKKIISKEEGKGAICSCMVSTRWSILPGLGNFISCMNGPQSSGGRNISFLPWVFSHCPKRADQSGFMISSRLSWVICFCNRLTLFSHPDLKWYGQINRFEWEKTATEFLEHDLYKTKFDDDDRVLEKMILKKYFISALVQEIYFYVQSFQTHFSM